MRVKIENVRKAIQALYYKLREQGLSHHMALAAACEAILTTLYNHGDEIEGVDRKLADEAIEELKNRKDS